MVNNIRGVYLVYDSSCDAVKIGYSGNIQKRFKQLQTGNPTELELVGVWENASQDDEKLLHQLFDQWQIKNEWFDAKPTLRTLQRLNRANIVKKHFSLFDRPGWQEWTLLTIAFIAILAGFIPDVIHLLS